MRRQTRHAASEQGASESGRSDMLRSDEVLDDMDGTLLGSSTDFARFAREVAETVNRGFAEGHSGAFVG